jgi:hypothetical protein
VSVFTFLSWYRGLESKGIFTCPQGNFPIIEPVQEVAVKYLHYAEGVIHHNSIW